MVMTTILASSWKTSLRQQLSRLVGRSNQHPRVAIVGIGNILRNDDGAGVLIAHELQKLARVVHTDCILIIQGGNAPENVTGELRSFAPNLVLLIDTAVLGEPPGTIRWISIGSIDGMSASTHSLPLSMLARYLILELKCDVAILGIQPGSNDVGEIVSEEVFHAVDEVVTGISDLCFV